MKEKIIEVLNDWCININKVEETELLIFVSIDKNTVFTSGGIEAISKQIGKSFLIEWNEENLILTWVLK